MTLKSEMDCSRAVKILTAGGRRDYEERPMTYSKQL